MKNAKPATNKRIARSALNDNSSSSAKSFSPERTGKPPGLQQKILPLTKAIKTYTCKEMCGERTTPLNDRTKFTQFDLYNPKTSTKKV